jgi:hypothetical protein
MGNSNTIQSNVQFTVLDNLTTGSPTELTRLLGPVITNTSLVSYSGFVDLSQGAVTLPLDGVNAYSILIIRNMDKSQIVQVAFQWQGALPYTILLAPGAIFAYMAPAAANGVLPLFGTGPEFATVTLPFALTTPVYCEVLVAK